MPLLRRVEDVRHNVVAHHGPVVNWPETTIGLLNRVLVRVVVIVDAVSELVIGELPASTNDGTAPTVMIYGHFDVQPPAPLELWESPPFELAERDGWYYARGIADDKGQLYTLLKAAELLRQQGALPVNLRIACDGEPKKRSVSSDRRSVCSHSDSASSKPAPPAPRPWAVR